MQDATDLHRRLKKEFKTRIKLRKANASLHKRVEEIEGTVEYFFTLYDGGHPNELPLALAEMRKAAGIKEAKP